MYRTITYLALRAGVVDDVAEVIKIAQNTTLKLQTENGSTRVFANDEELTEQIRTPEVNSKVSEVSVIPEVRVEMVKIQKSLGESNNIVAEGRDVTTVVYPNADIKIFLTASLDERANRRYKEYQAKNAQITIEEVKANLDKRDKIDSGRAVSPLRKAEDAIEFDNTGLTPNDDLDYLLEKVKEVLSSK
jgi:cytidylate kinase